MYYGFNRQLTKLVLVLYLTAAEAAFDVQD